MATPTGKTTDRVFVSNMQIKRHKDGSVGSASCHMTPVSLDVFPAADGKIEINLRLKFSLEDFDIDHHFYEISIVPVDPPEQS